MFEPNNLFETQHWLGRITLKGNKSRDTIWKTCPPEDILKRRGQGSHIWMAFCAGFITSPFGSMYLAVRAIQSLQWPEIGETPNLLGSELKDSLNSSLFPYSTGVTDVRETQRCNQKPQGSSVRLLSSLVSSFIALRRSAEPHLPSKNPNLPKMSDPATSAVSTLSPSSWETNVFASDENAARRSLRKASDSGTFVFCPLSLATDLLNAPRRFCFWSSWSANSLAPMCPSNPTSNGSKSVSSTPLSSCKSAELHAPKSSPWKCSAKSCRDDTPVFSGISDLVGRRDSPQNGTKSSRFPSWLFGRGSVGISGEIIASAHELSMCAELNAILMFLRCFWSQATIHGCRVLVWPNLKSVESHVNAIPVAWSVCSLRI